MEQKRSEIKEIGEFGLIQRIRNLFGLVNSSSVKGIGDDAAVICPSEGTQLVVSTDMLAEGIHFDLTYVPLRHLGYKAVVCNLSDIAAMNARPKQITVSLAISSRFSTEAVEEFYAGVKQACENYNVDLVGGDTISSKSGLVISITALGEVRDVDTVYRSGAKENDIICVTGDLGAAYLGLQILEREKQVYLSNPDMQPELGKYEYVVGRFLRPESRTDVIYELMDLKVKPTAMIDISDGLASELLHISKESQIGVRIFEDKIPIDNETFQVAIELNLDPITCALNGGEDYELLFTISQEDFEKIKNHRDIHFIGYVHSNKDQNIMITKQEQILPLQAQGWNHFNQQ